MHCQTRREGTTTKKKFVQKTCPGVKLIKAVFSPEPHLMIQHRCRLTVVRYHFGQSTVWIQFTFELACAFFGDREAQLNPPRNAMQSSGKALFFVPEIISSPFENSASEATSEKRIGWLTGLENCEARCFWIANALSHMNLCTNSMLMPY